MSNSPTANIDLRMNTSNFKKGVTDTKRGFDDIKNKSTQSMNQVRNSTDQATNSMKRLNDSTKLTNISMLTAGQSIASAAQSSFALVQSMTALRTKQLDIQRVNLDVAKLQDRINQLQEQGKQNTNEYAFAVEELTLKQEEQAIKNEELTNTYIQMGFQIVAIASTSIPAMITALGGVAGAMKALGAAMTFIQKHPVFLVASAGILAWELGISKLIENMTGHDLSIIGNINRLTQYAHATEEATEVTGRFGTTVSKVRTGIDMYNDTMGIGIETTMTLKESTSDLGRTMAAVPEWYRKATSSVKVYNKALEEAKREQDELFRKAGQRIQELRDPDSKKKADDEDFGVTSDLTNITERGKLDPSQFARIFQRDTGVASNFTSFQGPGEVLTAGLLAQRERNRINNAIRARNRDKFLQLGIAKNVVESLRRFDINFRGAQALGGTRASLFRSATRAKIEFRRRFGALGFDLRAAIGGRINAEEALALEKDVTERGNALGLSYEMAAKLGTTGLADMERFREREEAASVAP